MAESLELLASIVDVVDRNRIVRNLEPYGEPQLGRRGLYRALGGTTIPDLQLAMLWVLNLSDGEHDLLDIAERSGIDFDAIAAGADVLEEHGSRRRGAGRAVTESVTRMPGSGGRTHGVTAARRGNARAVDQRLGVHTERAVDRLERAIDVGIACE